VQVPLSIREELLKRHFLTGLPLVLPRGIEHNATTISIIGEAKTQPCKDTKEGW
jgi:hypothetical protein